MHTDKVTCNESDCPLPGDFTAPAMTKEPLRNPAAITIHFIREITCRWVIYGPPADSKCAGEHWLSSIVSLQKDLVYSYAGISLETGGGVSGIHQRIHQDDGGVDSCYGLKLSLKLHSDWHPAKNDGKVLSYLKQL